MSDDLVKKAYALNQEDIQTQPWAAQRLLIDLACEIERLRERLEMTHAWQMIDGTMTKVAVEPGSIPDGIEGRDETIRLQDQHLKKQADEIERLRAALREANVELKVAAAVSAGHFGEASALPIRNAIMRVERALENT